MLVILCSVLSHSASEVFFGRAGGGIGGDYLKVLYAEYTDDTFTVRKPSTPSSQHLGFLGKASLFFAKFEISSFVSFWYAGALCYSVLLSIYNVSVFVQVQC